MKLEIVSANPALGSLALKVADCLEWLHLSYFAKFATWLHLFVHVFVLLCRKEQVLKLRESTRDLFDHCFRVNQGTYNYVGVLHFL